MSESVPRGNRPAEELRVLMQEDGWTIGLDMLDAALRDERLAGRQEAENDILCYLDCDLNRPDIAIKVKLRLRVIKAQRDEVGVAGLTEERT